jgi:N-acetylglucosaminyl-diphospho-decaprenol L-rhamnosyltransferase
MPRSNPDVDAVIVTFNSSERLRVQLACPQIRTEFRRILVVDNASSDASGQTALDAGAQLLARATNDGLATAINAGAQTTMSEWFAVLNPDVLLPEPGVVARLLEHARDPDIGLIAPALTLPNGKRQDSARSVPSPFQLLARTVTGRAYGALWPAEAIDVPWVVAAFVLIRRSAFDAIGGFDERYFLYFEDVDFCVRLWRAGWRVRIDGSVTTEHAFHAESRESRFNSAARHHTRSAVRFFWTHPSMLTARARRNVCFEPGSR